MSELDGGEVRMTRYRTSRRTKVLAVLQLSLLGPMLWAVFVAKSIPGALVSCGVLAAVAFSLAWSAMHDMRQSTSTVQGGQAPD